MNACRCHRCHRTPPTGRPSGARHYSRFALILRPTLLASARRWRRFSLLDFYISFFSSITYFGRRLLRSVFVRQRNNATSARTRLSYGFFAEKFAAGRFVSRPVPWRPLTAVPIYSFFFPTVRSSRRVSGSRRGQMYLQFAYVFSGHCVIDDRSYFDGEKKKL